MFETLKQVAGAFSDPAMRHAIFGHMPIALGVLVIPLTIISAFLPNNRTLRWSAIIGFAILLVATFVTVNSGEAAEAAINRSLSQDVYDLIEEHEEMAEKLWMFAVAGLALMAVSAIVKKSSLRIGATALAAVVAIAGSLWTAVTAHHGGTLVYGHGVGTRMMVDGGAAENIHVPEGADARVAFFREEVLPILKSECFQCHNSTKVAARKSGRLDQTTHETMMKGGASGPPIVPGRPDESLLIQRVRGTDPEEEIMPPDEPLAPEQIAALEQWIRDGAVWTE